MVEVASPITKSVTIAEMPTATWFAIRNQAMYRGQPVRTLVADILAEWLATHAKEPTHA